MKDLLIIVLVVAFIVGGGAVWYIVYTLRDLVVYAENTRETVDRLVTLSLNPRTRVSQASMQSGAKTELKDLQKLGRTSAGRRVVVGGDADSQLNKDLNSSLGRKSRRD